MAKGDEVLCVYFLSSDRFDFVVTDESLFIYFFWVPFDGHIYRHIIFYYSLNAEKQKIFEKTIMTCTSKNEDDHNNCPGKRQATNPIKKHNYNL